MAELVWMRLLVSIEHAIEFSQSRTVDYFAFKSVDLH